MLEPRTLFHWDPEGRDMLAFGEHQQTTSELGSKLRGLGLLVTFEGHLNAGQIAGQVRQHVLHELDHQLIARFNVDELVDYRARRPHVDFDGEQFQNFSPPEISLYLVKDLLGTPFFMLAGVEPDFQWERFVSAVMYLIRNLSIGAVTNLDALSLPVPHTRSLGVTAHGNQQSLISGLSSWSPQARMLSGAAHLLEIQLQKESRPVVGYTLHVPHYLSDVVYPRVAAAGLEYAGAAMSLMLPADGLRDDARVMEADLNKQAAESSQIKEMISGLERNYDRHATDDSEVRSLLLTPHQDIPDAESLGKAVSDYLATVARESVDNSGPDSVEEGQQKGDDT